MSIPLKPELIGDEPIGLDLPEYGQAPFPWPASKRGFAYYTTPNQIGDFVADQLTLQLCDSLAQAESSRFRNSIQWVFLAGYYTAGDGGAALYQRVISEPSHPGKFQSEDGAWWEIGETEFFPEQFGATDADSTSSFNAIAAMPGAIAIRLYPKDYTLTGPVAFVDKSVSISGAGYSVSRILSTAETAGITFLDTSTSGLSTDLKRLCCSDFTMVKMQLTAAGQGGTAIEATWSYPSPNSAERALFKNLVIRGNSTTSWWNKGIRIVDGGNIVFDNCRIYNEVGHQTCLSEAAIEIIRDNASNIFEYFLTNLFLGRYINGVKFSQAAAGTGTIEGLYINNVEIVNVAYAFFEDNTISSTISVDSWTLTNVHWNVSRAGFKAGVVKGLKVLGCHLFFSNFGEPGTAPLEAGFNILLHVEGLNITAGTTANRNNATTTAASLLLLPTAAEVFWVRVEGAQLANWTYVADVQGGGTVTDSATKLFIGQNTFISTGKLANMGFDARQSVIGGNVTGATNGQIISFGQTFSGAPAVTVNNRIGALTPEVRAYNVTATGFTLYVESGSANISWIASGS